MEIWMIGFQLKKSIQLKNNGRSFLTQGDVALSLPMAAHPRLTADMRFGSCRASTQIAHFVRNFSYPLTLQVIAKSNNYGQN
jgi:hypothetical protein